MAREDDDDDASLPPIGDGTVDFLAEAKKGKPRNFLLIAKGNKVKYLVVSKKPIKKAKITEAKKLGYKGEAFIGVITGSGQQLVFNLAIADGYESEPCKEKSLKDFLDEHAEFKCLPSFAIVATPPEVPFDEEDLNHPLVAKFIKLTEAIAKVVEKRPDSAQELQGGAAEIRQLLQDGLFSDADPRMVSLETRIKQLLTTEQTQNQTASASNTNDDALKQKLQEALNKLVPQLKQAVTTFPEKKVELLTPVATIKKQIDSGALQEAKKGILEVGQLLKSLISQGSNQEQSSGDPLRVEYEQKLSILQPLYDRAIQEQLGDASKFQAVMNYANEQAAAGVYATAIKAIDRLTIAIQGVTSDEDPKAAYEKKLASIQANYDLAIRNQYGDTGKFRMLMDVAREKSEGGSYADAIKVLTTLEAALDLAIAARVKETDVIPENIIEDRKKFVASRWQTLVNEAYAEIAKLMSPIEKQVPEENPTELVDEITTYLDEFVEDLNMAIMGTSSATSSNMKPIELAMKAISDLRSKLGTDKVLAQLDDAKASLGVDVMVREKLISGLDELEARLGS